MSGEGPLDFLPLWALFATTLALVVLSVEVGHRFGNYRLRREHEEEGPIGEMVGATLGLLAFLLAFTFSLAADRFDTRRHLVLEEANAIGTTWLRAGMLPERGPEIRALLAEYVDVRLAGVRDDKLADARQRSEMLQARLWDEATVVARAHPDLDIVALFVESLNEVIDINSKRVLAVTLNRLPLAIWASLYLVAVVALAAMGYHAGVVGKNRSFAVLAVAISFSAVLWLIADLDRPREGSLTVSQQPLIDVRASMAASPATQP